MAQMPAPRAADDSSLPLSLQLRVLGNDARTAPVGSRSAQGITVEVADGAGVQVANAAVVFRLPDSGPSATFADGSLTAIAYTDSSGRAQVADIHWGNTPGLVNMRITAAKGNTHAGVLLEQTLTAPTISQNSAVTPVTALKLPAPLVESPRVPQAPAPGVIAEAKQSPGITVEHLGSRSRIAAEDDAPVSAKASTPGAGAAVADDDSPDANVPIRHMARTGGDEAEAPRVSISSAAQAPSGGHSKTKWLIALAVAAGAGVALALTHSGGGSNASTSGVTFGTPTVSVGHP